MGYESGYQALDQGIIETGTKKTYLARLIYPGLPLNTAQGKFSRAMNPENEDVHLNLEMIETILDNTRADDFIFYLCDKHGFERPKRKPAALENRIMQHLTGMQKQNLDMQKQLAEMMQELEKLKKEREKDAED